MFTQPYINILGRVLKGAGGSLSPDTIADVENFASGALLGSTIMSDINRVAEARAQNRFLLAQTQLVGERNKIVTSIEQNRDRLNFNTSERLARKAADITAVEWSRIGVNAFVGSVGDQVASVRTSILAQQLKKGF